MDPVERYEYDEVRYRLEISPYDKDAEKELENFNDYKLKVYLPTVFPKLSLGAIDHIFNPREPYISIDQKTLPSGHNHPDYIYDKCYYNIVQFFVDHQKPFPEFYNVAVDKLAHHITTEVDCESLFRQAGHLSNPTCSSTKIKTFELLIIANHHTHQIYYFPDNVKKLYVQIIKDKMCDK